MPTITAFQASPDGGRGLARDFPVRWALEEVGQHYDVRLLSFAQMKEPPHLALQPFGQIPTYEEGELALFESAAIILHIAETNQGLLPADPVGRARAIAWMFAAKSSVEPTVTEREAFILFEKKMPWFDERLPILDGRVRSRLEQLSGYLGDREWLEGAFSAGDLLMVNVLRRPAAAALLGDYPNLGRYVDRGEARPAFKRAFQAQLEVFEASKAA